MVKEQLWHPFCWVTTGVELPPFSGTLVVVPSVAAQQPEIKKMCDGVGDDNISLSVSLMHAQEHVQWDNQPVGDKIGKAEYNYGVLPSAAAL